jgi:Tetracyclin repressor-like, C-terminal domain
MRTIVAGRFPSDGCRLGRWVAPGSRRRLCLPGAMRFYTANGRTVARRAGRRTARGHCVACSGRRRGGRRTVRMIRRAAGFAGQQAAEERAQPWRQRVESLAVELRAQLVAHPGAATLMIGQPRTGPHALALSERLLELFADAGLTPTDAARVSPAVRLRVQLGRPGYRRPEPAWLANHGGTDRGPALGARRRPGRPVPPSRSSGSHHGQHYLHRALPLGTPPASRRRHHQPGHRPGIRNRAAQCRQQRP